MNTFDTTLLMQTMKFELEYKTFIFYKIKLFNEHYLIIQLT